MNAPQALQMLGAWLMPLHQELAAACALLGVLWGCAVFFAFYLGGREVD